MGERRGRGIVKELMIVMRRAKEGKTGKKWRGYNLASLPRNMMGRQKIKSIIGCLSETSCDDGDGDEERHMKDSNLLVIPTISSARSARSLLGLGRRWHFVLKKLMSPASERKVFPRIPAALNLLSWSPSNSPGSFCWIHLTSLSAFHFTSLTEGRPLKESMVSAMTINS
jgi:hypothetical protein